MALCAAGKAAISQHLAILGSPSVNVLSVSSVRMLVHYEVKYSRPPKTQVILKFQPPICLDYRARNRSQPIY